MLKAHRLVNARTFLVVVLLFSAFTTGPDLTQIFITHGKSQEVSAPSQSPVVNIQLSPGPPLWTSWASVYSYFVEWVHQIFHLGRNWFQETIGSFTNNIPDWLRSSAVISPAYATTQFGVTSTGTSSYPVAGQSVGSHGSAVFPDPGGTTFGSYIGSYSVSYPTTAYYAAGNTPIACMGTNVIADLVNISSIGTATTIGINWQGVVAGYFMAALYSDNAGTKPGSLLASTITTAVGSAGWQDISFSTPYYVGTTGNYWIAYETSTNQNCYYISTGYHRSYYAKAYGSFDATWSAGSTEDGANYNQRITLVQIEGYTKGTKVQYTGTSGSVVDSFSFYVYNGGVSDHVTMGFYDDTGGATDAVGGTAAHGQMGAIFVVGVAITASASGILTSVGLNVYSAAGHIRTAIYTTYSASKFSGLLGQSASTAAVNGWNDLAIPGIPITVGTTYYIAYQNDSTLLDRYLPTNGTHYFVNTTYGAFTDPTATLTTDAAHIENMRMIYAGAPYHKLWYSPSTVGPTQTLVTVNESAGTTANGWDGTLTNNSNYWFMWQWDNVNSGPTCVTPASYSGIYKVQTYGTLDSTWSGGTLSTENWYQVLTIAVSPQAHAVPITPAVSGDIIQVSIDWAGSSSGSIYVGLYSNGSGKPGSLLATSASTSLSYSVIPLTAPYHASAGTQYWIAFILNIHGTFWFGSGAPGQHYYAKPYGALDATWSASDSSDSTYTWHLTIGYTQIESYTKGTRVQYTDTTTGTGALVSFSFYTHVGAAGDHFILAFYDDSAGNPNHRLWYSGSTGSANTTWNTVTYASGTSDNGWAGALTHNAYYWFMWQWDSMDRGPSYAAGAANSGIYLAATYGSLLSTWSGGTLTTENWSMYATYAQTLYRTLSQTVTVSPQVTRAETIRRTASLSGPVLDLTGISYMAGASNAFDDALIDSDKQIMYVANGYSSGHVTRFKLPALTPIDTISLSALPSESTGVIDTAAGFAYFALATSPGQIVKISLASFVVVGTLTFLSGEDSVASAVIDAANHLAYFGTDTSPGKVVKVDLTNFTRSGVVTFNSGEDGAISAVIDLTSGYAYFGTHDVPAKIVKINLSSFTRTGSISLNSGENNPHAAVIDSPNAKAYFGTYTNPAYVVRINLSTFTRDAALDSGGSTIDAAAIDQPNQMAYFAYNVWNLISVDLATFTVKQTLSGLYSFVGFIFSAAFDSATNLLYVVGDNGGPNYYGQIAQVDTRGDIRVNPYMSRGVSEQRGVSAAGAVSPVLSLGWIEQQMLSITVTPAVSFSSIRYRNFALGIAVGVTLTLGNFQRVRNLPLNITVDPQATRSLVLRRMLTLGALILPSVQAWLPTGQTGPSGPSGTSGQGPGYNSPTYAGLLTEPQIPLSTLTAFAIISIMAGAALSLSRRRRRQRRDEDEVQLPPIRRPYPAGF